MSESKKRKRYTAKQKVEILREHLENQVPASEIAERYGVHPSQILRWKKQLFEGGVEIFSRSHRRSTAPEKRKQKQLSDKLKKAQEVITELTTENLELRKNYFGEI